MSARSEIEKKIERKNQEIQSLENQIKEARIYITGLQDALKTIPKDASAPENSGRKLRAGTDIAKAEKFILSVGKPLYITKILEGIGKEPTKANIRSLGGAMRAYVREGRIFTLPKPSTFGHVTFKESQDAETDLPPDFGLDTPTK